MSNATKERRAESIVSPSDYLEINDYNYIKPKFRAWGKRINSSAENARIYDTQPKNNKMRERKRARVAKHAILSRISETEAADILTAA